MTPIEALGLVYLLSILALLIGYPWFEDEENLPPLD